MHKIPRALLAATLISTFVTSCALPDTTSGVSQGMSASARCHRHPARCSYHGVNLLPPGASQADTDSSYPDGFSGGSPINAKGVVAGVACFGSSACENCGTERAFVYFPNSHKYVMLPRQRARRGTFDTTSFGITDDNHVEVTRSSCGKHPKARIYRVTMVGATAHWSRPCKCRGYSEVGINSGGIGLNNGKLGPAILTFPRGRPHITQLSITEGARRHAVITAVGTPHGFAGTQQGHLPTVWLRGETYRLPSGKCLSPVCRDLMLLAMSDHGRVRVVGSYYDSGEAASGDLWLGKRTSSGFKFTEEPGALGDSDQEIYGLSTDGSTMFGDCCGDPGDSLDIYFLASRSLLPNDPCGTIWGTGWGDSRGDILISADNLCLARLRH